MTAAPLVLTCGRCGRCIPCRLLRRFPALYADRYFFDPKAVPAPPKVELHCVHEGAIVEWCKTCSPDKEGRHVRACSHPNGARDFCTRDFVSVAVQACARCPDRQLEAEPC